MFSDAVCSSAQLNTPSTLVPADTMAKPISKPKNPGKAFAQVKSEVAINDDDDYDHMDAPPIPV